MGGRFAGEPVVVTARLQQGIACRGPLLLTLDGILASTIRRRAMHLAEVQSGSVHDGGLRVDQPADVLLPFAVCERGPDWHWAVTFGRPVGFDGAPVAPDPDVRFRHTRLNQMAVGPMVVRMPAHLAPGSGRYRSKRIPVTTYPAAAVIWHAVTTDPDLLGGLLASVGSIGAHKGTGEGHVLGWQVTPAAVPDPHTFTHQWPDGLLARNQWPGCLPAGSPVPGVTAGPAGLRPPYWHPARQHELLPASTPLSALPPVEGS